MSALLAPAHQPARARVLLLLAFAMISQRRILSLIHLFTLQGATLVAATAVVGYVTQQPHLYLSAGAHLRAQGAC